MMKKNRIITASLCCLLATSMISCEDLLSDYPDSNIYAPEDIYDSPGRSEGVLLYAYMLLPTVNYMNYDDFATDDMVTNTSGSIWTTVATGLWTKDNSPFTQINCYQNCYKAITQINTFLAEVENVQWDEDQEINDLYIQRLSGEAYGLRAWYTAMLLRKHGGYASDGELYGVPIVDQVIESVEDGEIQRSSYKETYDFIMEDCDRALKLLPLYWKNEGLSDKELLVIGQVAGSRINGITVKLLKSRMALTAASPAFADDSEISWQDALDAAVDVMSENSALNNVSSDDCEYWAHSSNMTYLYNQTEIFWSTATIMQNYIEQQLLPPSMVGSAVGNPSQNFVNCIPDKDGYPIDNSSLYSASAPYENRDSRLDMIILRDGSSYNGTTLNVRDEVDDNAINAVETSTRTGYYVRKFLDLTVAPAANTTTFTTSLRYHTYARYTEVLLNFAEAATMIGGKDYAVTVGDVTITPADVINAIRLRAGITSEAYVNSCGDDDFLELIKNERRIELFFEGFRFWDLRRWSTMESLVPELNAMVTGMKISKDRSSYEEFDVEQRVYQSYQIYGPVADDDVRLYGLIQNVGW